MFRKNGALNPGELSLFCYQLSLIFKSGIPFLEGMHLFADEMADSNLREVSQSIYKEVLSGSDMGTSLERQKCFPPYMVHMIRIAEMTGTLDEGLYNLSVYYDKSDNLKRKIRNAVIYPAVLSVLMAGIILLLILKILPMFHEILLSVGGEIPWITGILLQWSLSLQQNALIILIVLTLAVGGIIIYFNSPSGKIPLDRLKVHLPWFRRFNEKMMAAKFGMGMHLLLGGGLSFEESVEMVKGIIQNKYAGDKLTAMALSIREGHDVQQALLDTGLFPPIFIKMFNIGFKTGELEKSMEKISDIYENEVERSLSRITSAIEPVLVIILSVVIGVILMAVMLPLINIMASIG